MSELLQLPLKHVLARDVSRYQAVERDFSFTFADATQWSAIAAAIQSLAIAELQRVEAVEIFRDPKKNAGHFSILIRTIFQSNERTLVDTELAAWSSSMIKALQSLGGELRS